VDVARPEFRSKAVAGLIEDEERVVAHGLEVAVIGRLLLRAMDRALELSMSRVTRGVPVAARCSSSVLRRASPW